jgi:hypothetical protein
MGKLIEEGHHHAEISREDFRRASDMFKLTHTNADSVRAAEPHKLWRSREIENVKSFPLRDHK